jgi:RNA-directed DNA polymerase
MSAKRQKNQLVLAFTEEGRSEAPKASPEGTESLTAKCGTERPASREQLMEEVCERENCGLAYKRVKANKGSPEIDGMKVGELSGYLKQHWPTIREQLLRGTYQRSPSADSVPEGNSTTAQQHNNTTTQQHNNTTTQSSSFDA